MKERELVSAVRESAAIAADEHADRAVRATLMVLGERLAGEESGDLAVRLPPELAEVLPEEGRGEQFGVREFYERVAGVEGVNDVRLARRHARAVLAVIRSLIPPEQYEHLTARLPDDYDDLLNPQPVRR